MLKVTIKIIVITLTEPVEIVQIGK